jgi:hypothetical protein
MTANVEPRVFTGADVTDDHAVERRWPRPRTACAADLDHTGALLPQRPVTRPQPWLAANGPGTRGGGWDPWKFDSYRAGRMRTEDLCQLCGTPRTGTVYLLVPVGQVNTMVEMYGGAVCSLRCARLTAAVCPHYPTAGSPIAIYAVPRHERVDLVGCDLDNDDEYDVDGLDPITALTPYTC